MRYTFAIIILIFGPILMAQNEKFVFEGQVIDDSNGDPLPYVNIIQISSKRGTITNSDGFFRFEIVKNKDSLQFSFIGYQTLVFLPGEINTQVIRLKPEVNLLNMVTIHSSTDFLNIMIQKARKTETNTRKTAKTYFSLSSHIEGQRVEMLEGYYNGKFKGHDVEEMKLKNGRIALTEKDNRLFISSETSVVLCLYTGFEKDEFFPRNPLEMSRRKIDKYYNLTLDERYLDPEGRIIYVIGCHPKIDQKTAFESKFWIDSASSQIIRLKFDIKDAQIHPFVTLAQRSTLEKVDLSIRKNFKNIDGETFLKTMDFDYHLTYLSRDNKYFEVKSEAVLYAYNFENLFNLPLFEFTRGTYEDYRNINASPYNDDFWRLSKEFTLNDDPTKKKLFIDGSANITNRSLFSSNSILKPGFFEHPYVFWSEKRVAFKPDELVKKKNKHKTLPAYLYHLGVQIYLDYNYFGDSIYYTVATVFDPYKTYSFLPETQVTAAFINIYFDLMEIEKRKMEQRLKPVGIKEEDILQIYEECKLACKSRSDAYFKEVRRGTNLPALKEWSNRVKEELGIDNYHLYQLDGPEKTSP